MMSSLLKKRSREDEAPLDSVKRFHGHTEQEVLHILEEIESAGKLHEEENCTASEEIVSGVMKSLEEEIGIASCSTSYEGFVDDFVAPDTTNRYDTEGPDNSEIDLDYLLGASDDELGIPPSPLQNLENQPLSSCSKEDFGLPLDLAENTELNKGFVDNWRFEEDLVDYGQFGMFEDPAAFDLLSQAAFIDGDYSPQWRLETPGLMY